MGKNDVFNSFSDVKNILDGIATKRTAESSGERTIKNIIRLVNWN